MHLLLFATITLFVGYVLTRLAVLIGFHKTAIAVGAFTTTLVVAFLSRLSGP